MPKSLSLNPLLQVVERGMAAPQLPILWSLNRTVAFTWSSESMSSLMILSESRFKYVHTQSLCMRYKNGETLLLRYLGSSPVLRIADFFLDNPLSDYSKNEVVRNLEMGRVTFFKYWKELEKSGALKETRQIGRATMYQLDRENEVVEHLIKLDMAISRNAMEKAVEAVKRPVAH